MPTGANHAASLIALGRYERSLGASVERLLENALDWEHLPHLHDGSFEALTIEYADDAGWRARVSVPGGGEMALSLALDRSDRSWISETRRDGQLAARIVSHAHADGPDRCHVSVAFFAAGIPEDKRAAAGAIYRALYDKLYDEDEAMMIARAAAIRAGPAAHRARREASLADGTCVLVPLVCPHQGLPLDAEPDADGILTCPWHGYRFDARTGLCVSDQRCRWAA